MSAGSDPVLLSLLFSPVVIRIVIIFSEIYQAEGQLNLRDKRAEKYRLTTKMQGILQSNIGVDTSSTWYYISTLRDYVLLWHYMTLAKE